MTVWGIGAVCGPVMGPLVGGFAAEAKGWMDLDNLGVDVAVRFYPGSPLLLAVGDVLRKHIISTHDAPPEVHRQQETYVRASNNG